MVQTSGRNTGGPTRPALLAGVLSADGELVGVEVTYLAPNGRRAEDLRLSRKTVGTAPAGCAVRLDKIVRHFYERCMVLRKCIRLIWAVVAANAASAPAR